MKNHLKILYGLKNFIHADREVYQAGVYNSPKHLNDTKENNCNVTDILKKQLSKFSSSDIIFIGGEFNSRMGSQNDFFIESEYMTSIICHKISK